MCLPQPLEKEEVQYRMSILVKITGILFLLICFPSFVLTYSYNSCVTFQGATYWVDFFGTQLMFLLLILPLIHTRLFENGKYWLWHAIVAIIICLIQFGAFIIHTTILTGNGEYVPQFRKFLVFYLDSDGSTILDVEKSCFEVNFGAIYYTIVANLFASIIIAIQSYYAFAIHTILTGKDSCLCIKRTAQQS